MALPGNLSHYMQQSDTIDRRSRTPAVLDGVALSHDKFQFHRCCSNLLSFKLKPNAAVTRSVDSATRSCRRYDRVCVSGTRRIRHVLLLPPISIFVALMENWEMRMRLLQVTTLQLFGQC